MNEVYFHSNVIAVSKSDKPQITSIKFDETHKFQN